MSNEWNNAWLSRMAAATDNPEGLFKAARMGGLAEGRWQGGTVGFIAGVGTVAIGYLVKRYFDKAKDEALLATIAAKEPARCVSMNFEQVEGKDHHSEEASEYAVP